MKFSPTDWNGTFQGTPDYFAPQKGSSGKGRTSPVRGRSAQRGPTDRTKNPGMPPMANPSFAPPPMTQMPPPPPPPMPPPPPLNTKAAFPNVSTSAPQSATKFTQDEWNGVFKEPSFVLPQATKETSPRRGSTATKRPKPVSRKASAVPAAPSNGVQADSAKAPFQAFAEDAINGDGDAMDIDITPPAGIPTGASKGANQTYKAGNPITFSPSARTAPSSPKGQPTTRPRAGTLPTGTGSSPSSGKEKANGPGLDGISGLKNVEPLTHTANGGLSGLGDLKDTLPFKSKSSGSHPTKPNTSIKLKIPTVPVAPNSPSPLNRQTAESYFKAMGHYCKSYREFSKTMAAHFVARDAELEDVAESFVSQRGETAKKVGFGGYMDRLKEDEKVMEAWKIAQNYHRRDMQKCEEVRNKIMKFQADGVW